MIIIYAVVTAPQVNHNLAVEEEIMVLENKGVIIMVIIIIPLLVII